MILIQASSNAAITSCCSLCPKKKSKRFRNKLPVHVQQAYNNTAPNTQPKAKHIHKHSQLAVSQFITFVRKVSGLQKFWSESAVGILVVLGVSRLSLLSMAAPECVIVGRASCDQPPQARLQQQQRELHKKHHPSFLKRFIYQTKKKEVGCKLWVAFQCLKLGRTASLNPIR